MHYQSAQVCCGAAVESGQFFAQVNRSYYIKLARVIVSATSTIDTCNAIFG